MSLLESDADLKDYQGCVTFDSPSFHNEVIIPLMGDIVAATGYEFRFHIEYWLSKTDILRVPLLPFSTSHKDLICTKDGEYECDISVDEYPNFKGEPIQIHWNRSSKYSPQSSLQSDSYYYTYLKPLGF